MLAWLSQNWGSLLVGGILLLVLLGIVLRLYHNKKNGKSSCGCGCEHCAMSDKCHSKK